MLKKRVYKNLGSNLISEVTLFSALEYYLFLDFRKTFLTARGEEDKPVNLFRLDIKKGRGKIPEIYQKRSREGNYWSKAHTQQNEAIIQLWDYLLYDFAKKDERLLEVLRNKTAPMRRFIYECHWEEMNLIMKKENFTILEEEFMPEVGLQRLICFFYSSLVDNSFNQITVKKTEEILGPNLDVFLFLLARNYTYSDLRLQIKIAFEKAYWLVIGREFVEHSDDFDGIKVGYLDKTEVNFVNNKVKVGNVTKETFKDIKYPKVFLLKRIENLLNTVQEGLNYLSKEKGEDEENVILPRMYPFPGTKNVLPRVKKNNVIILDGEQPEEVREVRKEKINILNLIGEEALKKELKKIREDYFLLNGWECKKYVKTILGIIFRQYLNEIVLSQILEEKYNWYVKVRKDHLEFAYRKDLEQVEKMTKVEREKRLQDQEEAIGTIGIEGIVGGVTLQDVLENAYSEGCLLTDDGEYSEFAKDFAKRMFFETQMAKIYDLAFFLGVYKSLFKFAREIEQNALGFVNWYEPSAKERGELGLRNKHEERSELSQVRENISVPFFWILHELVIMSPFTIKIEGKEHLAKGINEIPENGILKATISKYKYFGEERTVEKEQQVVWDVSKILE